jgi:hypothetical protein
MRLLRRYRSILDRVLSLQYIPIDGVSHRQVSLSFLHRQVIWITATEFFLFFIPLWAQVKPYIMKAAANSPVFGSIMLLRSAHISPSCKLFDGICPFCYLKSTRVHQLASNEVLPAPNVAVRSTNCESCQYCYYCVAEAMCRAKAQGTALECPQCFKTINSWYRV